MAFFSDLLGGLGTFTGLTSARDNGRAHAITDTYGDQLSGTQGAWDARNQQNLNLAGQIGGTNYNAGAQQAYQNQLGNYQQQQGAAGMLYNQATGQAPSYADLQMQAGLGLANNQVQSAALSQQGGVMPGLSQRNMLNAQAMQNANIVSQGQANRAQELNTAQNNYSNLLGQMGQTAAGMTGVQNQLGQQQYQQAANMLAYNTNQNQQAYNNWNDYSANVLKAQTGDINGLADARTAQAGALGNTATALMTQGASLTGKKK